MHQAELKRAPKWERKKTASGYSDSVGLKGQVRLALLEEAADGGIALEADGDFVCLAGFAVCACLGEEFGTRGPIGLVFGEPHIGGYFF